MICLVVTISCAGRVQQLLASFVVAVLLLPVGVAGLAAALKEVGCATAGVTQSDNHCAGSAWRWLGRSSPARRSARSRPPPRPMLAMGGHAGPHCFSECISGSKSSMIHASELSSVRAQMIACRSGVRLHDPRLKYPLGNEPIRSTLDVRAETRTSAPVEFCALKGRTACKA